MRARLSKRTRGQRWLASRPRTPAALKLRNPCCRRGLTLVRGRGGAVRAYNACGIGADDHCASCRYGNARLLWGPVAESYAGVALEILAAPVSATIPMGTSEDPIGVTLRCVLRGWELQLSLSKHGYAPLPALQ